MTQKLSLKCAKSQYFGLFYHFTIQMYMRKEIKSIKGKHVSVATVNCLLLPLETKKLHPQTCSKRVKCHDFDQIADVLHR